MATNPLSVVPNELDRASLKAWIDESTGRRNWIQIAVLSFIQRALYVARESIFAEDRPLTFFENSVVTVQFQIDWRRTGSESGDDWWRCEHEKLLARSFRDRFHLLDAMLAYVEWYSRFSALRLLTNHSTMLMMGGTKHVLPSRRLFSQLETASPPERDALLREAAQPVFLCSLLSAGDDSVDSKARQVERWNIEVESEDQWYPVSLFAVAEPLAVDDSRHVAYFPITVALTLPQATLENAGLWNTDGIATIWARVLDHLDSALEAHGEVVSRHRPPVDTDAMSAVIKHRPHRPRLDRDQRALFVGDYLVKQFAQPSTNQWRVLLEFDDMDWSASIEDPLPADPNLDPKQRIRETVKSLNASHRTPGLIRFHMDGTGEAVRYVVRA